ncbi:hypothetical protein V6W74_00280 [Mannheimia sp. HC-2023]
MLVNNDPTKNTEGKKRPTDNEGKEVAGIDTVISYEHNIKGEIRDIRHDNNVDGKPDYHEKLTLNANGQITQREFDLTNDGLFDKKEVNNSILPSGGYRDENGNVNGVKKRTYYNLVQEKGEDGSLKITDEVITSIDYYQYDGNNQWIGTETDRLGDTSIDYIYTVDLDEQGRVKKAYYNTDGKGDIDRVETYTRDPATGFITKTEIDNGNNGSVDVVRTYIRRDPLGNVLEYEVDNRDNGVGVDTRYIQTFDEYGNEKTQETYSYNAVTKQFDLTTSIERTFDQHNNTKTLIYPNHTVVYERDEFGRIKSNKAAEFNRDWRYEYNPDGTISTRESYNRNGELESKQVYTEYYAHNRATKAGETYNSEGKLVDSFYYDINDQGVIRYTLIDEAENGKGWDTFNFGDKGRISALNFSQDFTSWNEEKLAELGNSLSLIRMTQGAASQLTLNAEVVAKISEGGLKIEGAPDRNDTLNLSGFVKSSTSNEKGYDLYTAKVGEEDVNLYVDTKIDTILG